MGLDAFEQSGNEVLGYVAGAGVVVAVLALTIIGGRMIHANFTGDPWIAARGMAELPWVVLGVVLLVVSGSLTAALLQGSRHETNDSLGTMIQRLEADQNAEERAAADCAGALKDPRSGRFLCPDDDGWERLSHTVPLSGPKDARCTYDGAEDCYEYCFVEGFANDLGPDWGRSPCTPGQDDYDLLENSDWIWRAYHCPNLPSNMLNEVARACPDAPDDTDDVPREYMQGGRGESAVKRYYICTHFPEWAEANKDRDPDDGLAANYCDV